MTKVSKNEALLVNKAVFVIIATVIKVICSCLQKRLIRSKSIVYSGHQMDNFAFLLVLESKF